MRTTLKTIHKIIHGDSRQMNLLADKSLHLVITSPILAAERLWNRKIKSVFMKAMKVISTT